MSVRKYHQITLERDGCQYLQRKAIESFGLSLLWLVTGPKPMCHILNQSDMANLGFCKRIDSRSLRRVHHSASPTTFHCIPRLASSPLTFVRINDRFFVCTVNDVQRDTETLSKRTMLQRYSCLAHFYRIPPKQMTRGSSEVIWTLRNAIWWQNIGHLVQKATTLKIDSNTNQHAIGKPRFVGVPKLL